MVPGWLFWFFRKGKKSPFKFKFNEVIKLWARYTIIQEIDSFENWAFHWIWHFEGIFYWVLNDRSMSWVVRVLYETWTLISKPGQEKGAYLYVKFTSLSKKIYSYPPNKRAGSNKRVGWKIGQNQIIVQGGKMINFLNNCAR